MSFSLVQDETTRSHPDASEASVRPARRPLTATYRLQLNSAFTFEHARARVDYFERLGVSHLYLSPILAARRGSQHGYDVVDPSRLNPELGTDTEFRALVDAVHARGMGIIVDIVPNHMGIGEENPYWDDVLTHGERSRYARWFDICWRSGGRKLVLPVLGDELERVLERGELSVRLIEGETPRIQYYAHSFPVDPSSLPPELQLAQVDPEETGELTQLFSGVDGRDRLRALLAAQHYSLMFWKRGPTEINYRRFFDVNELAAVCIEDPTVFDETHALILRLVHEGLIDGLRVDHIDGLLDPEAYLRRLREATSESTPIFVEKILAPGEMLPASWPVQGTTGYEFLNEVENVFLDPSGTDRTEAFYRRLRRLGSTTYDDIARAGKAAVLRGALRADVNRVAAELLPLAKAAKKPWKLNVLAEGITEFVAALPVYRTYIDDRSSISEADRKAIDRRHHARDGQPAGDGQPESARQLEPARQPEPVRQPEPRHHEDPTRSEGDEGSRLQRFIRDTLLSGDKAALPFVRRLQQLSGPAAAKGVEDTALYVYVPVTSRGEVGREPDQPIADALQRFHRANASRAERWPESIVATNTHDTKRSADVRARLDALTTMPQDWERAVRRWRKLNAKHRCVVKGRLAPDTNTEYLMYQIILALWPPPRAGRRSDDLPDRTWRDSVRDRLTAYARKAAREAKTRTSWVEPDDAYERALTEFVSAILEPGEDAPYLPDVARLVSRVAPLGARNSLARVAIHLTAPGTPDLYQGDELWNFSLVDPDNRRAVDFDGRSSALQDLGDFEARLASGPIDLYEARLKLWLTQRLLCLRSSRPELFRRGDYQQLTASGPRAGHIVAFARTFEGHQSITIVSRLVPGLKPEQELDWWRDTAVHVPQPGSGNQQRSVLLPLDLGTSDGTINAAQLFAKLPVAVLVS
jgi:(1->4)-alpha-D-glucan 1-alpha-D-glucosylmutase